MHWYSCFWNWNCVVETRLSVTLNWASDRAVRLLLMLTSSVSDDVLWLTADGQLSWSCSANWTCECLCDWWQRPVCRLAGRPATLCRSVGVRVCSVSVLSLWVSASCLIRHASRHSSPDLLLLPAAAATATDRHSALSFTSFVRSASVDTERNHKIIAASCDDVISYCVICPAQCGDLSSTSHNRITYTCDVITWRHELVRADSHLLPVSHVTTGGRRRRQWRHGMLMLQQLQRRRVLISLWVALSSLLSF